MGASPQPCAAGGEQSRAPGETGRGRWRLGHGSVRGEGPPARQDFGGYQPGGSKVGPAGVICRPTPAGAGRGGELAAGGPGAPTKAGARRASSRPPTLVVPACLCSCAWFSLPVKLNLVLFANDLCLLSNRPTAGSLQVAAWLVEGLPGDGGGVLGGPGEAGDLG